MRTSSRWIRRLTGRCRGRASSGAARGFGATHVSRCTRHMHGEQTLQVAQRVHMIGIAGSGMAALASLLLQMGKRVTGSDVSAGSIVTELQSEGAVIVH